MKLEIALGILVQVLQYEFTWKYTIKIFIVNYNWNKDIENDYSITAFKRWINYAYFAMDGIRQGSRAGRKG